jgi:hypothetical protein
MKLLIMKFSSASCYFLPLGSKYSPQRPIFKHCQCVCSSLIFRCKVSHPYKTSREVSGCRVKLRVSSVAVCREGGSEPWL